MLGREKYLEEISKKIPEYFDVINNGHTLYIDTKLMSNLWGEFQRIGVSTKKLNFIKLNITINEQEVSLDEKTRHYFPYPNKTYLTYGHQHNKNGLLIELDNLLWDKIKKDGYFKLNLSYSLLDGEKDRPGLIYENKEENENCIVTYANVNMKINVKNIDKGNHLVIQTGEYGLCNPIAFFSEEDYNRFKEHRNSYISDKGIYCPAEIDTDNDKLWWGFNQILEINIEPYDIYYINEKRNHEAFSFLNILDSYTLEENPDFYKIVGKPIKNILVHHSHCSETNIVIKTDKSIDEINKLIYLIQYIECDLPAAPFNDGIYQNDLKTIFSDFYKMKIEDYSNQEINYEIDIHNNWEWSGRSSFDDYKKDWEKLNTLTEQEKEIYDETFTKDLYKSSYKNGLEFYLINHRLKQIKRKQTENYKLFSNIKKAILDNNDTFYWKGWCGRDEEINIKDFLYKSTNQG